jgi:LysM repeat protein
VIYVVQPGDTLFSLARDTGTTIQQLLQANCLTNSNYIVVGQSLYVPRLPPTKTPTPLPPIIGTAIAQPGKSSYSAQVQLRAFITGCAPSTITFSAAASSSIDIAQVRLEYRYEAGSTIGSELSVVMSPAGNGQYEASVDNNSNAQAAQVLQGQGGLLRWRAVFTDSRGVSSASQYQVVSVARCGWIEVSTPTPQSPPSYIWYFPRPNRPPANNGYAREGLFMAIDHEAISYLINGRFGFLDLDDVYRPNSYDVAKAKEYLAAARQNGFNNEIAISFYEGDPVAARIAQLMQMYWKELEVGTVLLGESHSNYGDYEGDVIVRPDYPR